MKQLLHAWGMSIGVSIFLLFFALPSAYAYGEGPTFAGSTTGFPVCDKTAPKMVWPFTAKAAGNNAVGLSWGKTDNVSSWTVAYGTAPGKYIYGVSGFGNDSWRSLTVNDLPAGTYYFVVRGNNGCKPGPFSNEWRVTVGGGAARMASAGRTVRNVPSVKTVPPTYTGPKNQTVTPTLKPTKPGATVPAPAPKKVSWWQNILNFLTGKK